MVLINFRRFRVWLGEQNSGTRKTAVRFLESVGVPVSSFYESKAPESLEELYGAADREVTPGEEDWVEDLPLFFRTESLDVAMVMTIPGSESVCRAMASGRIYLFPLGYQTLRLLTSELDSEDARRQIAIGNIPGGTYVGQPGAVPTVAVPVLLVAGAGEDPERARRVLDAVKAEWAERAGTEGPGGCRYPEEFPPVGSLGEANLTLLRGFGDQAGSAPGWFRTVLLLLIPAALVVWCVVWLIRSGWHREIVRLVREEKGATRAVLALSMGGLIVTFFTYFIEHRINENFSTPWESFWSITVYLFSGLEDRNPYTPAGRVVAACGLLLGPLFFAFLTGWLARVFIRWERRMPNNLKGHCLLVNWNERAIRVVNEIHHKLVTDSKGVQVIVALTDDENLDIRRLKEAGMGTEDAFEDVYISIGDPTSEKALRNANAHDAKTVVILADDGRSKASQRAGAGPLTARPSDERTIRSLVMLRRIAMAEAEKRKKAQERKRRSGQDGSEQPWGLHVIVELVDSANEAVVDEIARDFPGVVERVSGLQVRTCLVAQAALSDGVTQFYRDLLRVSDDTNEVYVEKIPDSAVGKSFREYAAAVMAGSSDSPLIPVGVQRGENGTQRMYTNPRRDQPGFILEEGDRLVVMAYQPLGEGALPQG